MLKALRLRLWRWITSPRTKLWPALSTDKLDTERLDLRQMRSNVRLRQLRAGDKT